MEKKPAITAPELFGELQLSHITGYALLKHPECPAFRVGKKWIIPREAFYEWFNKLAKDKAVV